MDSEPWRRRLTRSSRERMWAGVAGGLAAYFDVDPTLMRLMWVVATVVTAGLFVALYFVMWVMMPLDTELPSNSWRASDPPRQEPPPGPQGGAPPDWQPTGGPGYGPPYGRRDDYWYGPGSYYGRKKRSAGIVLIVLGLLFLSGQAGLFRWINWGVAWAIVLIVLGVALLLRHSDRRL